MTIWYKAKHVGRHGEYTRYTYYKGLILKVYKRRNGWAYTCLFHLIEMKDWVEQASDGHTWFYYMGEAQLRSFAAAESLLKILGPLVDPVPDPPAEWVGEPTEEVPPLEYSAPWRRM